MDRTSYRWDQERQQAGIKPRVVIAMALLIIVGIAVAVLYPPIEATNTGIPVSRKVSAQVYPSMVVSTIAQPEDGQWLLPAGVARVGDNTFVLDTGDNRILDLDPQGRVTATLDSNSNPELALKQPMAIATDGTRLFIANSLAGNVLVLSATGVVEKKIALPAQEGDQTPRPIGIAARADGSMVVADAENHRVLFLNGDGQVVKALGTGTRTGGQDGFNVPAAMTLDSAGNVYVVDTLNGRVVELSANGDYLGEFGRLADTAGSLARPKGVAVDAAGRVFVSDGLQAAVEVFAPDGAYLGMIGRRDGGDAKAGSIFEAPSGLWLSGNRLMVIDGLAGLITLELSEPVEPGATGS